LIFHVSTLPFIKGPSDIAFDRLDLVVAKSQMIFHNSFDFKPEYPMVKASLHHFVLFGLLQPLYQPMHLTGGSVENALSVSGNLLFGVMLFAHEILQVLNCSICFEKFLSDWTSFVQFLFEYIQDIILAPAFKCPP